MFHFSAFRNGRITCVYQKIIILKLVL